MKIKTAICIALSSLMFLTGFAAHATTLYHMICRGGAAGNTRLSLENAPNANQAGMSTFVTYYFERYKGTKTSVKSDGSHLSPGQCSWSTDVMSSVYTKMLYTIQTSRIQTVGTIVPTIDKELGVFKEGSGSEVQYWVFDSGDPNQRFIPTVVNNMAADGVAGSIFDDAMIFHFYVAINSDRSLQLDHILQ